MMATAPGSIPQAAAISLHNGQVCLVTSSSGKRWVVPKGCMEPGKSAGEIALQEAWEEAGLVGVLHKEPLGSFLYEKYGAVHHVIVFLMDVTEVADDWPERSFRQRCWLTPTQAMVRIQDRGLREILRGLIDVPEVQSVSI